MPINLKISTSIPKIETSLIDLHVKIHPEILECCWLRLWLICFSQSDDHKVGKGDRVGNNRCPVRSIPARQGTRKKIGGRL